MLNSKNGKRRFHRKSRRPFEQDGVWGAKAHKINGQKIPTVDWNEHTKAEEWRSCWADMVNKYLQEKNIEEKIDHRSIERQSIDLIPSIHLGVVANQMEKCGIKTDRGNINLRYIHFGKYIL